ncbi:MAG: outer membrane protein assembly factor BamD [Candidatus Cloacimonadaceae bacterium]
MKYYLSLLSLILLLLAGACSRNVKEPTAEQKLASADAFFAKKKYAKAAQLYDDISFERKSAATAYATVRLADSYFAMNKFVDARLKYQQFIDGFPDHQRIPDAYFRIGECFLDESLNPQYDQYDTVASIDAFRNFIDRYPLDSRYPQALDYINKAQYKLIQKKYQNGYIYYKMKDYSAALMYFEEVTDLGNIDDLDKMSLYYSALLHLHQKNLERAETAYQRLANRYPDSKEAAKLKRKFR